MTGAPTLRHERLRTSPFRSLDFFTSADAEVFAGREEEIEEVATRILAGDTLVVYGPSGVGKTSLLCAGVLPALEQRRGYRVTYVRPLVSPRGDVWSALGADPAEPLVAALDRLPAMPLPGAARDDAREEVAVRAERGRAPHVLILDQLEELFTRFGEFQRRPLWDGLVEILDNDRVPLRLVMSLREEYLHLLDCAHPKLSALLDRRYRLRGLAPFGARTAIVRPLVAGRTRYEPELVDRCVADLTEVPVGHTEDDGVVDPLLLQIVCSEMYRGATQRDGGAPTLTLAGYAELGGPAGVFRRHLDELFDRVDAGDHLLLELVLQEMTTAHATKLPTTISRLSAAGLLAPHEELQALLDKLASASLVRRYDADPEPWYELIHDRLVHALPEHFAGDPRFLRLRYMRELIGQLSKGLSESMIGAPLLNRAQLAELVEPFRRYIRFTEPELNLLFRSAVAIEYNTVLWRDAYEAVAPGRAPAIVLELLGQPETRRGAVAAVGALGITAPAHRAVCLDVALADNDPRMTATACDALRTVAGPEEAVRLAAEIETRARRPRALWVLAELTDNAAIQSAVPVSALRAARREHERRCLAVGWDTVQRLARRGFRTGLSVGVLAYLPAATFWCLAMLWLGRTELEPFTAGAALIAIGSVTLASSCGYVAARAAGKLRELADAKERKLEYDSSWQQVLCDRGVLATLAIALSLGVAATMLVIVAGADVLGIADTTGAMRIARLLALTWLFAPTVLLSALAATEWTLPLARWHRTRSMVIASLAAGSLSWLFALGAGLLLLSVGDVLVLDRSAIVVEMVVLGAWCSACATSIAATLAEPMWKQAQARAAVLRGGLSWLPVPAFFAAAAILVARTPLPFWGPIVDVGPGYEPAAGYALRTSWISGRWVRLRNRSDEVRIVSMTSIHHPEAGGELLLIPPGIHRWWFSSDVGKLVPLRRIDLASEQPEHCTYAVAPLQSAQGQLWTTRVDIHEQAYRISVRRVGCRVELGDGTTAYYSRDGTYLEPEISGLSTSLPLNDDDGAVIDVDCNLHLPTKQVHRMDIILLFDDHRSGCL